MASKPLCLVTLRDLELLQALERTPLTVRQLLKWSRTFAYPFTTERRVQERLQRLCAAGRVRRWHYATAGRGALSYYRLSPLGYQLLHGPGASPTTRGRFGPVGIARQKHTHALADIIVHTIVCSHTTGIRLENFRSENTLCLKIKEQTLYPDCAFTLVPTGRRPFHFFVELDNSTEAIWSAGSVDSWQKKIGFYERFQDVQKDRFRVLVFTTGHPERLQHILTCAANLADNPQRSLVYGIALKGFLGGTDVLTSPCFQNHRGLPVALLPAGKSNASLKYQSSVPKKKPLACTLLL